MLFPPSHSSSEHRRVVVTGAGVITAHGVGWRVNAEGFRAGRRTFGPISLFDATRNRVKTAAQVVLPERLPAGRLSERQLLRLDRAAVILLLSTYEAWAQAGWTAKSPVPFVLGTTGGGMTLGET